MDSLTVPRVGAYNIKIMGMTLEPLPTPSLSQIYRILMQPSTSARSLSESTTRSARRST